MRAVRYHQYGDAAVMHVEEIDRPVPGAGQVLVEVAATSFNPVDVSIRAGYLQGVFPVEFPHTPGVDVAGTVAAVGPGVGGFAVGDMVIGFLPMNSDGAAAEFVVAPAAVLTAAPTSIALAEAAALPAVALTAWQVLYEHAGLKAGQRVLINGAGGSVGGFAVQFAKLGGAFVIATASSRSAGTVRALGADQIIDYTTTAVADAVSESVDAVLNLVTGSPQDMAVLVGLVRPGGVLVTTATPADPDPARHVRAAGMSVRSDAGQLAAIVAKVNSGQVRVDLSQTRPFSDIVSVHEESAAGSIRGKVVLVPTVPMKTTTMTDPDESQA